ncbi:MAG: cyclic nucleotide-binding domain-containing protein [Geminicoccaceae bacterium]|nr:cyclic nucleotide-binding domain-containing protein [Geminicoccaceae bacterium]MCX8100883.1 cyclic nucleotide-binding domain-containing protein [Geminicoccaceae bacterium]MDW8369889.1 cyclic nucleotide-binding domain-containing protein [Geminicoccaceae bacterium]
MRGISVCRSIEPAALDELERIMTRIELPAGRVLFDEAAPAEGLFTLVDGVVKLFKMLPDGRRQITGFLLAGDFLGLAFFNSYAYSAEAVTDATLCRFPRDRFLALLERHPALEKELLGRASSELAAAQEQMLLLGRKSAKERVASFLLMLARRQQAAGRTTVALAMSRHDIADYLGLTIETVSRGIRAAAAEGLIRLIDRHHYVVVDDRRLRFAAAAE